MSSVVEEIQELHRLSTLSASIEGRLTKAQDELGAIAPPRRADNLTLCGFQVKKSVKRTARSVAKLWKVSESAVYRFALYELLKKYDFDASEALSEIDLRAIHRSTRAQRPLTTAKEAHSQRSKRVVLSLHIPGDDPPQPS